ncbi:MAG: hypothetical protein KF757_11410 [Phycisphaeraceae bacterium]|nr:hypothetical protein [Phycisphaeraceae bacterium]
MDKDGTDRIREILERLVVETDRCRDSDCALGEVRSECRFVNQVVYSFILWESTAMRAERAIVAIDESLADVNELRVCLPSDLIGIIGSRYPRAEERSRRLRACLGAVYEREHAMDLSFLEQQTKRDARAYLDGMEGMVPFVASRVMLLELGGHAFPMDGRLCAHARALLELEEKPDAMALLLERAFYAGEIPPIYRCLERLMNAETGAARESNETRETEKGLS